MKNKLLCKLTAAVLLLTLLTGAAVAHADALEEIRARGYIVIATEGDWAPWTYHNEENKLVGLDVEIGLAIAEYIGVEARFEETQWDAILSGVDSGRFDIACNGVGYTAERAEKYNFSTPYVYTHMVLVVRSDNDSIHSFEDLAGRKTANTASSTYAVIAREYGAEVVGVDALADTLQLVMQGRVDATINSQVTINDYMMVHPESPLKIVAESEGEPVVIPVRKSEETDSLLAVINEALDAMRADGRLSAISQKYFNGLDLTAGPDAE